jgi:hypothetical protein
MIVYYVNNKKYTHEDNNFVPWNEISSPDENTPAYENLKTGYKVWCEKGRIFHRLTGVALIRADKSEHFYLNDQPYENVKRMD